MKGKAKRLADARRKAQKAAKKQSAYERYLYFTKKYDVVPSEILNETSYNTAVVASKKLSRNKTWRVWTPETLARAQARDELTDKEFNALYKVARKKDPTLTKSAFDKQKGYREIIAQRDALNEELKLQGLDGSARAAIISAQIYGSE